MPTLVDIDGFAHQTTDQAQANSGFLGIYDNTQQAAHISFPTPGRTSKHACRVRIDEPGAACGLQRTLTGAQLYVSSFYFRADAAPGATSIIFVMQGPTNKPAVSILSSGGARCFAGGTGVGSTSANICDGLWHLIDFKVDTSATTYTYSLTVDGTVVSAGSTIAGQVAANMTAWRIGTTGADTFLYDASDMVISATSGDFPIGPHVVLPLYPNGEGTETLGTTNKIQDEAAGQSNLYLKVDDWNGGVPSTADYVTYASTTTGDAASNFAEFTMTDPDASSVIWDVIGLLAGFASGTGADTADLQILSAHGGTLIDHIGPSTLDYSGSTTVLGFHRGGSAAATPTGVIARPAGGWTPTKLSNAVLQWGRSSDTNGIPRLTAVMLEYAAPQTAQSVTPTLTATAAIARSAGKAVAYAATATAAIARVAGKLVAYAATATAAIARACAKTVNRTATATAAAARSTAKTFQLVKVAVLTDGNQGPFSPTLAVTLGSVFSRAVSAGATLTAAIARAVGKPVDRAMTGTAAIARATSKAVARTITGTVSVTKLRAILAALGITAAPAVVVGRAFARLIAITMPPASQNIEGASARLGRIRLGRTRLGTTVIDSTTTSASMVTVTRAQGKFAAIAMTMTTVASKRIPRVVTLAITATTALVRGVGKRVTATVTAGIAAARGVGKLVAYSATATAAAARSTAKTIALSLTATVAAARRHPRTVALSATLTPAVDTLKAIFRAVTLGITASVSVTKTFTKAILAAVPLSATLAATKRVAKTIATAVTATADAVRETARATNLSLGVSLTVESGRVLIRTVQVALTATAAVMRGMGRTAAVTLSATPRIIRGFTKNIALGIEARVHVIRHRIAITYRLIVAGLPFAPFKASAPETHWKVGSPER